MPTTERKKAEQLPVDPHQIQDVQDMRPAPRGRREAKTQTTKERLNSAIKGVRDQLRKDAGLSGDADRLPQLTWLLFLKSLDDFDRQREELKEKHEPLIAHPYRWRDWASNPDQTKRPTGDNLIAFVNSELMPYLGGLAGTSPRDLRSIVGKIFAENPNRIRSGTVMREVIDRLSTIDFTSSEDVFTVSHFYETMLREMRDAAGDSGEFYTPRPVVKFIIDRLKPKLGERVLDPACGTGGFLVAAYEYLKDQVRKPSERRQLWDSLIGAEKKAMPYLLGVMNLMLHGVDKPNVLETNALSHNIQHFGAKDYVEVIATNPPFGGEEEKGILNNFPADMRTSETALLYFQHVMARLKRPGGRCGIVLPNGFLFGGGIAAEVKKKLLTEFNLHTIVRLPNGVFAPYTSIPTNLLFFEACDPGVEKPCTREIWFYELTLADGRKNYSKTKPLQFEEFDSCVDWWDAREEGPQAWRWDFEADHAAALAAAILHWNRAAEKKAEAIRLRGEARQSSPRSVDGHTNGSDPKIQEELFARATAAEQEAREAQVAGDDLYWPIFNLDKKNPRGQADIEHMPPEQLVESILEKERRITEIMYDIRKLLAKAEA